MKGILPFNTVKIKDKHLLSNKFGGWILLSDDEYQKVLLGKTEGELQNKLEENKLIISESNAVQIKKDYNNANKNLFNGTSLHIIAMSKGCNSRCVYCHSDSPYKKNINLKKENAIKILNHVFSSNAPSYTIEFQGGEALLNWENVKYVVQEAETINKIEKKGLRFILCTNLTMMTDKHMEFIKEHNIVVSTSLDGPENVHNANRQLLSGSGTYDKVVSWIKKLKNENVPVGALPTITKNTLNHGKELVDLYVSLGLDEIYLRFLNYLGYAKDNWDNIGYTAEEFLEFWKESVDYIIELNKKGSNVMERTAQSLLKKIVSRKDTWNTEMMSPCGAGRCQIVYDFDGGVYTCDEGRMVGDDTFKLGNVKDNNFSEIMGNEKLMHIANASIIYNYCQTCAFNTWCSTCPVNNYSKQGSIVPRITETMKCKISYGMFTYLFEKLQDPEVKDIFHKWLGCK